MNKKILNNSLVLYTKRIKSLSQGNDKCNSLCKSSEIKIFPQITIFTWHFPTSLGRETTIEGLEMLWSFSSCLPATHCTDTRAITVLQLSKAHIGSFVTPLISLAIIFQSHFWVLIALLKIQTIFMLFPAKQRQGKLYMSNEGTAQKLRKKGFWSHQHALQTCEGKDSCSSTNRFCLPQLFSWSLLKKPGLT